MSDEERAKWDERYSSGHRSVWTDPSPFLETALEVVVPGPALVLACGSGRNALRLAEAGFDVEAIDISAVAIDLARREADRRGLEVEWRVADLDEIDIEVGAYQLVTMIRYANRRLFLRFAEAVAPNGWLLVEQHMRTSRSVDGPESDEFRLAPSELLTAFSQFRVVEYSERLDASDPERGTMALARLLACKGDPGW